MKITRKILAYVLSLSVMLSCVGISTYAAPADDLAIDNFSLVLTESDNSLSVALNCNKQVTAWAGAGGFMSVTDKNSEDASSYFTLTSISNSIGDNNNDTSTGEWSSTDETEGGITLAAGTWTTYTYTVADSIPEGTYTFKMTFTEGDNFDGELEDYSIGGQSITATYTVGSTDGNTDVASVVANGETALTDLSWTNATLGVYSSASAVNNPVNAILLNNGKYFAMVIPSSLGPKAYIDVEYYTAGKSNITVRYTGENGAIKTASNPETRAGNIDGTAIFRYTVADATFVDGAVSSGTAGGVAVAGGAAGVYIRSVTITKIADNLVFEPEFNSSDFTSTTYLYDEMTPNLRVTNNNAEKMYITADLKLTDSADNELLTAEITDEEVFANDDATLVRAATILAKTKSNGKYKIIVDGTYKVGDGTPTDFSKTIEFERQATFYQSLQLDDNGALWFVPTKRSGVPDNLVPDKFNIIIKDANGVSVVDKNFTPWDRVNLTSEIQAKKTELGEGTIEQDATYTVTVTAYKGTQKRTEVKDKTYIYGDIPEFLDYPSAFYENSYPKDIKIKNNGDVKTVSATATITLGENVIARSQTTLSKQELEAAGTKDETTGDALDTVTVVPAGLIRNAMQDETGEYVNGDYVLTLTVQWGDVECTKTYNIKRADSTKQLLCVENGNPNFKVQLEAGAGAYAPGYYEVTISGGDLETAITYELPMDSIVLGAVGCNPLDELETPLDDGTYTISVTSYHIITETKVKEAESTVTYIKCDNHAYENDEDKTCNKCDFVRAINGANLTLGTKMDYHVYVGITEEQAEGAYAVIKQNGTTVEKKGAVTYHSDKYGYKISLPGLAAKELCDELTVEVYDKYGNKIAEVTESFAAYAYRTLRDVQTPDNETRMIAYMIDYATAAQKYFGYNSEKNSVEEQFSELGDIDLNVYRTSVNTACETERTVTYADPSYNGSYVGTNFVLDENITMNLFTTDNVGYAEITFTDYLGNSHTMNIEATEANKRADGYYVFNISEFVTADGGVKEGASSAIVVTASFYDNATDKNLIVTVTDSMASYVNRATKNTEFLATMMKFTTSARTYFETR